MKRFLCLTLAFLMLVLCACASEPDTESKAASENSSESLSEQISESVSEPEPEPVIYTIGFQREYADFAYRFQKAVKDVCGAEYPIEKLYEDSAIPSDSICFISDTEGSYGLKRREFHIETQNGVCKVYLNDELGAENAVAYLTEKVTKTGFEMTEGAYDGDYYYALEKTTVGGVSLADMTIVWAKTQNEAKYYDVAELFAAEIEKYSSYELETSNTLTDNAIILGCVNSIVVGEASENDFGYNEYEIRIFGTQIAVIGGNACAVWQGCKDLISYLEKHENVTDTAFADTADIIKVACVGDSITQSNNSTDWHETSYPIYLQRYLGYDYLVKNFGHSGYSVCFADEYSYSKSDRYRSALAFVPDVMIFMLGTNDGNPSQAYKTWEGDRVERYENDVNAYLDKFLSENESMQIFMCIPAPLFESTKWTEWEEWGRRITEYVCPLNRKIAEDRNLPIIDIYSWAVEHPEVFTDGLHPYNETYNDYAKRVYDEIKDVIIKP